MILEDKNNSNKETIALIRRFVESNQRKRLNLVKEIEMSFEDIYVMGSKIFDDFDQSSEDWALGWILQVLKKHKPEFFNDTKNNRWFNTESSEEINYDSLQLFLLEQKFEDADRLTSKYLRKLAGKSAESRGYVFFSEVKNMSSIDLATIDKLWNIYSQGKFGFSVQAKLLKSVNKKYDLLWPKIGWKKDGIWTRYPSSFFWSIEAPEGHMPLVNQLRGVRLMDSILKHPSIASRHNNCL